MLSSNNIKKLREKAYEIRKDIILMLTEAKSGHTAGSLGMADIFSYLYFYGLNHRPNEPDWEGRDKLILSNGHICPVMYAAMSESGYFPKEELMTLRKLGSRLQGHPHKEFLPMVETSSGPLGEGLSQTIGMALADRINGKEGERSFYCLMGDGELDEGNVWEAALNAAKEKLSDIIAIIDRNNIQIDGFTKDVMPLEPLADKWVSFGFYVQEIDGHNFKEINKAIDNAKKQKNKPSIIIAKTIPGKGVPDFENKPKWHGVAPNEKEKEKALEILDKNYQNVK